MQSHERPIHWIELITIVGAVMALLFVLVDMARCQEIQSTSKPADRNPFELKYSEKAPRQWTFWTLTAASAGVTAVDCYQTSLPGREISSPWLYGTYPNQHRVQLGLTCGGEVLVSALASRWLRNRHSRFWWLPQAGILQAHTRGMIHNFRVGQY